MRHLSNVRILVPAIAAVILAACSSGRPSGGPSPEPPEYAALPDTIVCVIDRSTPRGLRDLPAKVAGSGVVLRTDGEVRPLDAVHPVNVIAGYAGRESWLTRGEPISVDGRRYTRTGGERRIGIDLVRRAGEYQGVLVFAGQEDTPPPDAVYIPTAPGCIFQAYVREDLMRQ